MFLRNRIAAPQGQPQTSNPSPQDGGGLGALNALQQPAPSLLNQQVPSVQQAPMQQPVQQQPSFSKSGFFPFSPALDSLGNPVTQLRSPELSPGFLNQPPVLGPDLITQNSPGMTSIEPQFDKFGNQIQALPPGISVGVPGTPSYGFSPMIPEDMPPRFINTPVGRVSPGGIGGGMSQPGFSGTQPTLQPRVPNVNPDQNPNWQWGNTGGPRTIPFTNQPLNPLRPSPSTPFGGFPQPRVPNVNAEPRNPLYPFGNTGGPFPGSPAPTPAGGFYDPRPGMIDEARRNGTIFAGDENFTPAPAPTPQNRPNPFLGGLSSLLKRKFRR